MTELTAPDGSLAAHYEYAPFGGLTASSGFYADSNPFRFSSEYFDYETGLVYYNYRYYSPELGRWLSRDPIEEEGGVNLYYICYNDLLDAYDLLGNEVVSYPGRNKNPDPRGKEFETLFPWKPKAKVEPACNDVNVVEAARSLNMTIDDINAAGHKVWLKSKGDFRKFHDERRAKDILKEGYGNVHDTFSAIYKKLKKDYADAVIKFCKPIACINKINNNDVLPM